MINSLALAYMGTRAAEAPQKTILDEAADTAAETCPRCGHGRPAGAAGAGSAPAAPPASAPPAEPCTGAAPK